MHVYTSSITHSLTFWRFYSHIHLHTPTPPIQPLAHLLTNFDTNFDIIPVDLFSQMAKL